MSGWVFRIGIIAVIAIGAFVFRDRISGNAGDLQVGDCFDQPAGATDVVEDVQHHPCNESHTAEVFFVGNHPAADGAAALTDDAWYSYFNEVCGPAFTSYTGISYETTEILDIGAITPLEDDWKKGDREVTCYAYRVDEQPMTSSVKKTP